MSAVIVPDFSHRLQGPTVVGEVSLTCDAWQAANTDGYFAVTAHWIEETARNQVGAQECPDRFHSHLPMPTVASGLVKYCSRLLSVSASNTRCVWTTLDCCADLCSTAGPHHLRQCIKQWDDDARAGEVGSSMQRRRGTTTERGKSSACPLVSERSPELTRYYSCLAHVINLATQAVIETYSKSLHYDPKTPDADIPC